MTPRERVLTALRRQQPDRVPKTFDLTPGLYDEFRRRTGQDDVAEHFRLEPRYVGIGGTCQPRDFSPYLADVPKLDHHDEWGVGAISAGFHHFERSTPGLDGEFASLVYPRFHDSLHLPRTVNLPGSEICQPHLLLGIQANTASSRRRSPLIETPRAASRACFTS